MGGSCAWRGHLIEMIEIDVCVHAVFLPEMTRLRMCAVQHLGCVIHDDGAPAPCGLSDANWFLKTRRVEQSLRIARHVGWVRDVAVTHTKGLLRCCDAEMNVIGARRIDAIQLQTIENAQDHQ